MALASCRLPNICCGTLFPPSPANGHSACSKAHLLPPKAVAAAHDRREISHCAWANQIRNKSRRTTSIVEASKEASLPESPEQKPYEFSDEGPDVEVRVSIPAQYRPVQAGQVGVDTQDDSLLVTLATETKLVPLLVARPLYNAVRMTETMWFLDDDVVVISMKKSDRETQWPGLIEAWAALGVGVARMLKSCSLFVVGSNSEANWAIAQELASGLGYTPLETRQVVEQITDSSKQQLEEREGQGALAEAEIAVIGSLSTNLRIVVGTLGDETGAAAVPAAWRSLHAGICIWLDWETATTDPVKHLYSKADVVVRLDGWSSEARRSIAERVLRAVKHLLEADPKLPGKKGLYVKLGSRGDWPDIQAPGWKPFGSGEESVSVGTLREIAV